MTPIDMVIVASSASIAIIMYLLVKKQLRHANELLWKSTEHWRVMKRPAQLNEVSTSEIINELAARNELVVVLLGNRKTNTGPFTVDRHYHTIHDWESDEQERRAVAKVAVMVMSEWIK